MLLDVRELFHRGAVEIVEHGHVAVVVADDHLTACDGTWRRVMARDDDEGRRVVRMSVTVAWRQLHCTPIQLEGRR